MVLTPGNPSYGEENRGGGEWGGGKRTGLAIASSLVYANRKVAFANECGRATRKRRHSGFLLSHEAPGGTVSFVPGYREMSECRLGGLRDVAAQAYCKMSARN